MEVQTTWVRPPRQIGGLDHLAVQAPCINIYGRLLPGITNVTDRARYYSFYPWIVWALEQEGHKYNDDFVEKFRRADCLFTLIAHRHSQKEGNHEDHAGATIGSGNMAALIEEMKSGSSVSLADVAKQEGDKRYFKNKLGGLGQYYLGVFAELRIMDGNSVTGIKNTNQIGRVIAEAMDQHVNRELFIKTLSEETVSASRLDELHSFCPCQLSQSKKELKLLTDVFFVQGLFSDTDMMPRRRTLQTILHLADGLAAQDVALDLKNFRACVYSGALSEGTEWILPERLHQNRRRWAIYQRNELLSLAVQGIFYVLLDTYEETGQRLESAAELSQWFLSSPEVAQLTNVFSLDVTVSDLEQGAQDWLPDIKLWSEDNHEFHRACLIESLCTQSPTMENRSTILESALRVLIALKVREDAQGGYEDLEFSPTYFQAYPINLRTYLHHSEETWGQLSVREWIAWLSNHWGVQNHFMVALRKLRGQAQSTFRIRPSDYGLEVIAVPQAVSTMPRFNQTVRILKDIGALVSDGKTWVTSELGKELKEVVDA